MMAAEGRGPMMHANAGIGRVVNGPPKIPESRPSKEKKLGSAATGPGSMI
jgi:hypothetical protein